MDIFDYLEPAENFRDTIPGIYHDDSLGCMVRFFKGDENCFREFKADIVIIGVAEQRNGYDNHSCSKSPDYIRKLLYSLRNFDSDIVLFDAGNVRGLGLNDRYQALKEVSSWFLDKGSVVVIIGGTQELTFPLYDALSSVKKDINIVIGDAMIDLDVTNQDFSSRTWINRITEDKQEALNDLSILGVQNYLVSSAQERYIQENNFDIIRLGEIRGNGITKSEIPLRDSHIVSLDMRMIKGQYQFSEKVISPHGIEPFEACLISRYAGLSDSLNFFGLFEVSDNDSQGFIDIALASQMIWHFIDGYINRCNDFPKRSLDEYKYYVVQIEELGKELSFYQNPINGRWWMKVPFCQGTKIVACESDDYQKALLKELPEKWWRFFLKCRNGKIDAEE